MKTRKSKFLKPFAFASLALLIGAAGTFAFAPINSNNPPVASAGTPIESLVTPKEDDPVIFTTESGLEIKWGNAASASGGGNETGTYSYSSYTSGVGIPTNVKPTVSSGNLSGFPYFTTTNSGTTYTWVIIGRNSNVSSYNSGSTISGNASSSKTEYKTLSDWKSKINSSDTYENFVAGYSPTYKNFFNNTFENSTPAGAALNGYLDKQYTARQHSASLSYSYPQIISVSSVKTSTEIPSGCVLALLNTPYESIKYYASTPDTVPNIWDTFQDEYFSGGTGHWCNTYTRSSVYSTSDTFGFGSLLNSLQTPRLIQRNYWTSVAPENGVDGSSGKECYATKLKFFPLGGSNYTAENFKWETYLTAAQYKTTQNVWGRSLYNSSSPYYTNTSGTVSYFSSCQSTAYMRPACVLKVQ